MKKFKQIDIGIQILIALIAIVAAIISPGSLFIVCIIFLGWQLASIAVHEARLWFIQTKRRRYYHIAVLLMLFITLLSITGPLLFALPILFCIAMSMIIYYFIICIWELQQLYKRPLSILK
jgi:hypothetical protein